MSSWSAPPRRTASARRFRAAAAAGASTVSSSPAPVSAVVPVRSAVFSTWVIRARAGWWSVMMVFSLSRCAGSVGSGAL